MSTLDQAFFKAYSKQQGTAPPARTTGRTQRGAVRQRASSAPADAALREADPYAAGAYYRLDTAETETQESEPQDEPAEDAASAFSRRRRRLLARAPRPKSPPVPRAYTPSKPPRPKAPPPIVPEDIEDVLDEIAEEPQIAESANAQISADAAGLFSVTIAGPWQAVAPIPTGELPAKARPAAPKTAKRIDSPASLAGPHFSLSAASESAAEESVAAEKAAPAARTEFSEAAPNEPALSPEAIQSPRLSEQAASAPAPATEALIAAKADSPPISQPAVSPPTVSQPTEEPAAIPAVPTFEPAWEVERFAWPAACDGLLASSLDDWGLAVRQLLAGARQGTKTLAVTGLRRGEGRSTLALCLARLAAQTGARIAVIDSDFENPQVANLLGVGTDCDWRAALADGLPLSEAAIVCLADRLTILPLVVSLPFKQTSFGRPAVAAMLKSAADAFDLVLVDAGPIAGPEHTASWGGKSCPFDGVLLVRDLRRTDAEETAATVAHLRRSGLARVVVLENFAEPRSPAPTGRES